MRTRWDFIFDSWNANLRKSRSFTGTVSAEIGDERVAKSLEIEVKLDDYARPRDPSGPDEVGVIHITMPGSPEDGHSKELACFIADEFRERLSFPDGKVQIRWGALFAERLPETPEEVVAVGGRPCWANLHFVEMPWWKEQAARLVAIGLPSNESDFLRLFNVARALASPIERFLAFFKIIEKAFGEGGGSVLGSLSRNKELAALASRAAEDPFDEDQFETLLKKLVRVRDNCAHLRGKTGYPPGDPRLQSEVVPNADLLQRWAQLFIEGRSAPPHEKS